MTEVQIGPLFFTKETGSGMSISTEDEHIGYCEGVWPDTWDAFLKAAGIPVPGSDEEFDARDR